MASIADSRATPPPALSPVEARRAWKRPENGPAPVLAPPGNPIMDADSWPALPGQLSPAPPPKAPSPKAAADPPTPPPVAVVSPVSLANSGAKGAVTSPVSLSNSGVNCSDDDDSLVVRSPPVRRALVMPAGDDGLVTPAGDDGLVMRSHAPELSPMYSPNARSNGSGGDHNQNGRFGSHPHGRNGGYAGGNRRGNAGRHGHEHHGGFDGQRRGGSRSRDGHGPGHQQHGVHQPSYVRVPPAPLPVMAAAPPPPPFVGSATPQTPPYGAPMGFPAEMAPHVYYFAIPTSDGIQALPFVPPPLPPTPPAMLISPLEQLQRELLVQIDYYFSDENLCKDIYLRQHMDDQGWVPVSLVAGFNQVQLFLNRIGQVRTLTNNLQFILDTMLLSTVVEVQGDKIRRRARWEIWLLRRSNHSARSSSGSQSPVISNVDSLASQFQSVGLERTRYHPSMQGMPGEALLTRSATSDSIGCQAPTLGGLHSNGSGPIFGQQTARSLLRSDTF